MLQADGGTRTAAITGACVAVVDAFEWMVRTGRIAALPVRRRVAAVSVGIVDGEPRLDLDYAEDVRAEVDMNVVMSSEGRFVEVQGTGEHGTFDRAELDALLDAGRRAASASCSTMPAGGAGAVRRAGAILLATRSAGKLRELEPLFARRGDRGDRRSIARGIPESPEEEAIEAFDTFEENALRQGAVLPRA